MRSRQSPCTAFQPTNFPQYAEDALHGYPTDEFFNADGHIQHPMELALPTVMSISQAQRVTKIHLLRNRQQGAGTFEMSLAAFALQPMDVFQMNFPLLAWANKLLEVNGTTFVVDEDQASGAFCIRVNVSVNETAASVYEWTPLAEELTVYDAPASPTQTPAVPPPPGNMTLISGPSVAYVNPDGTVTNMIEVTFDTPLDNQVVQIQVQYQPVGAASWVSAPAIDVSLNIGLIYNVIPGATYNVRLRSTRASGVSSDWIEIDNYIVAATPRELVTITSSSTGKRRMSPLTIRT